MLTQELPGRAEASRAPTLHITLTGLPRAVRDVVGLHHIQRTGRLI